MKELSPTIRFPRKNRNELGKRSQFSSIVANTGWLSIDRLFRAGIGFFISAWMVRMLGPRNLGALDYATAFVTLFWSAATLGFDSILIRDLVRFPENRQSLLGAAFYLKLTGCFVSFVLVLSVIYLIRPGDKESATLIAIIAAGKLFTPLDTIEIWFQSQLRSKLPVIAKNIAFSATSSVRVVLLLCSAGTSVFAWALALESALNGAFLLMAYRNNGQSFGEWKCRWENARQLIHESWPLILTNITIVVNLNVDKIILRQLLDSEAVGVYSAAVRISESWHFIPLSLVMSAYPALTKLRGMANNLYNERIRQFYDSIALLCIGTALFTSIFAKMIVKTLYGVQYSTCAPILMIHVWSGLFLNLAAASGRYFNIENETRIVFYRGIIGAVTNVALNFLFIPYYGIKGAAYATVISYAVFVFSLIFFSRSRGQLTLLLNAIFLVNTLRNLIKWFRRKIDTLFNSNFL